jgi:hypothetical protein
MNAPRVTVREVRLYERDVTLRLPFKFGVVTLTEAPQAFVRLRIAHENGREEWGTAAELMVPKWFDKNPDLSNEDNFDQLRLSLSLARDAYTTAGPQTAFGLFAACYASQISAGGGAGLNPLAACYGPALLDRAVLDALCRLEGLSFYDAIKANLPGMAPAALVAEFDGFDMDAFLAGLTPSDSIHARHTVGMVDPLVASEEPVGDGLPETLEEIISTYGHTYFKIKVRGETRADIERLKDIAVLLDRLEEPYFLSLDGNEQYDDVEGVLELTTAMAAEPGLARFNESILFIEQPIKRAHALERSVEPLSRWKPVIVDESDGDLEAFPTARNLGYSGISSKTCKGFYKSLINAARCRMWNRDAFFMSAEDLTCQSGVSVQQDLALVSLLGLTHVERNGHHYVNGMAGAPEAEQAAFLAAHPDLYDNVRGRTCLRISAGRIAIGSLNCPGFAIAAGPDVTAMKDMPIPSA